MEYSHHFFQKSTKKIDFTKQMSYPDGYLNEALEQHRKLKLRYLLDAYTEFMYFHNQAFLSNDPYPKKTITNQKLYDSIKDTLPSNFNDEIITNIYLLVFILDQKLKAIETGEEAKKLQIETEAYRLLEMVAMLDNDKNKIESIVFHTINNKKPEPFTFKTNQTKEFIFSFIKNHFTELLENPKAEFEKDKRIEKEHTEALYLLKKSVKEKDTVLGAKKIYIEFLHSMQRIMWEYLYEYIHKKEVTPDIKANKSNTELVFNLLCLIGAKYKPESGEDLIPFDKNEFDLCSTKLSKWINRRRLTPLIKNS